MELHEKIRFFRRSKKLTQEQMAEKLNITPVAYSNIETGKSGVLMDRLEEIAKIMEVDLLDLLSLGEKNVIILHGDNSNSPLNLNSFLQNVNFSEKTDFIIAQKDKELELLKEQNTYLKEMISLLKKTENS
jgi:transcriptional regulator with XRE-family HTH domain